MTQGASSGEKGPRTAKASRKRIWASVGALFAVAAVVFFGFVPTMVAKSKNATHTPGPWPVESAAAARHADLFVVDMHADSLLWDRNLGERVQWGHLDLPRMREANLALQGFTVVTKVPKGMSFERNRADSDSISALMFGQLRPPSTWTSLEARALAQAEALRELAAANDDFDMITTREQLRAFVDRRRSAAPGAKPIAGWLGLEGAHALEGDIEAVDRLFDAGYRMMAPVHFFDNELGGSAHGWDKGGLTDFGRQVIARQEALGIAVDLAHASPALLDDVLDVATKPVLNSHTGVKATCDSPRNLSDDQLRRIAANGGVVGIAFFEEAVCGKNVDAIVAAILHTIEVVGVDHVAFGSDFDGAVAVPFDVTGMAQLTAALHDAGLDDEALAKVSGQNVLRVLEQTLPAPDESERP